MKVLVVGGGGREHTLVWKISQSDRVKKIFCAPGNAGIARIAECVNIKAEDIQGLVQFAEENKIDLTVVGPEAPLVAGIVDEFERCGLRIFGPGKSGAMVEGSKVFAKTLMNKYGIPTAAFEIFDDPDRAMKYLKSKGAPIVVKADGLAAGKGAFVCQTKGEALEAVKAIMVDKVFGASGDKVVVEERLRGQEATVMAFVSGERVRPMEPAQDYKPVFDEDKGPNTGGMGCYSPVPAVTKEIYDRIYGEILKPMAAAMQKEGIKYKGILYAGLILTEEGPKILEFNCRYGDPENQAVLPRLKSDLVEIMEAVIDERLEDVELIWSNQKAICVVLASGGYPGKYETGKPIYGLEEAEEIEDVIIFHAGTALRPQPSAIRQIITSGGRVLGVTALGEDFQTAISKAYQAVEKIKFEGMHYRKDIGKRALD